MSGRRSQPQHHEREKMDFGLPGTLNSHLNSIPPVLLLIHTIIQSGTASQGLQIMFTLNIRISNLDQGVTAGIRQAGLSVSETVDHLGSSGTTVFRAEVPKFFRIKGQK